MEQRANTTLIHTSRTFYRQAMTFLKHSDALIPFDNVINYANIYELVKTKHCGETFRC